MSAASRETQAVLTDVATTSTRQRDGIARIDAALQQLNGVTQSSAASAEEAAAAGEELGAQASGLAELVGRFAVDADEPVRRPDVGQTPSAASGPPRRRRRVARAG